MKAFRFLLLSASIATSLSANDLYQAEAASKASLNGRAKHLGGSLKTHMRFPWTHFVTNEVRKLKTADFTTPIPFHMKLPNGKPSACSLWIQVATNSVSINKYADAEASHGYIVGLITNPDDCVIPDFKLSKSDTVAWFVQFTKPLKESGRQDNMGHSGLVRLRGGLLGKDAWFPGGRDWGVGYCNHAPRRDAVDEVMVLTRDSVCDAASAFGHNGALLSAELDQAAREVNTSAASGAGISAKSATMVHYIADSEDLALWFACGGDCCYTSARI